MGEGYVTGLEPATNYPNQRATERRHGRVVTLQPGEIYRVELKMEVLLSAAEVHAAGREVAALQAGVTPQVSRLPLLTFPESAAQCCAPNNLQSLPVRTTARCFGQTHKFLL